MLSAKIYTDRREALQQEVGSGIILLLGNGDSPINFRDNPYRFRQDSTFLYYFGISAPDLTAIIDIDQQQTIIFGDEMTMDEIVWMGRMETLAEKAKKTGINHTQPAVNLYNYLEQAKSSGRTVHFLPPYRPENQQKINNTLQGSTPSVSLIKAVVKQRSVKSTEELIDIEKAVNTSVAMHLSAMRMAKPGLTERDLVAHIQQLAIAAGGDLSYLPIMTIRGEILHNHYYGHTLEEGQLLLNDSGAETAMGYAGDLTRTFPVSKLFSSVQHEAYDVVLNAFEASVATLSAGVRYLDVHLTACKKLVEGLKSLGLMRGDTEEAVAAHAHTLFFQCGTGHLMGLDVHDMEDLGEQYVGYTDSLQKDTQTFGLKSLRLGKELEQGYVVTVEPGLYFIPELIDSWKSTRKLEQFINYEAVEKFRNFGGIRIEDNFVITSDGYQLLGAPLAKTVKEIEAIRAEAF